MRDEKNPAYIFSGTDTDLLVAAVNGEIDLDELARAELANRGLDKKGKRVGFDKAAKAQRLYFSKALGRHVTIPQD